VSRATEVYSREFDSILLKLPERIRRQVEAKIADLGCRLTDYPHHRLQGRSEYRLRVGDYRIIYDFDQQQNVVYLITLGNRREIYR
jgi:mRNA interferase RelE/StbE